MCGKQHTTVNNVSCFQRKMSANYSTFSENLKFIALNEIGKEFAESFHANTFFGWLDVFL